MISSRFMVLFTIYILTPKCTYLALMSPGTPDLFTWLPIQCLLRSYRLWNMTKTEFLYPPAPDLFLHHILHLDKWCPSVAQIKTWSHSWLLTFFTLQSISKSCKFHHQNTCWISHFSPPPWLSHPIKLLSLTWKTASLKNLLLGHSSSTFFFFERNATFFIQMVQ